MDKILQNQNFKEISVDIQDKGIETLSNERCIIGGEDYLLPKLKDAMEKAISAKIIVAFLMESGVRLLEKDLIYLKDRNIPIKILTGNYLNITQPSALYLLKGILKDKVDLRFYKDKRRSFHPKAYIFNYEDGGEIFIGSSNISKSALTSGIEWNYRINKKNNKEDFFYYERAFDNLFYNESIIIDDDELKKYSSQWINNKVMQSIYKDESKEEKIIQLYKPRGAQIEALYELEKTREEGMDKGLVIAATGVGKTYIAAFDSKNFNKVLFVAHREEILNQAEQAFKNVRENVKTGFFGGGKRDINCDVLFATVQTLGRKEYLNEEFFSKDYFDYIVIDEFHHAVSQNYQNIIEYFNPKFLLGLTATPERLDNKDVFAICDYNTVYEVGLKESINKSFLVPFRYYGIFDETDYEKVKINNGKYDEKSLEKVLMINKRAELVLNNYKKFNSKRALGFCSSKNHAEYMAKYFNKNGIKSCAVYSGNLGKYGLERRESISKLKKGEMNVIFSVDMFNEGLDIPSVDLVMFLRPTESPTVFLQQLGRGLRKSKNKEYLNVLDFIGNYKRASIVPFLLTGKNIKQNKKQKIIIPKEEEYPNDCIVNFEWKLIDVFEKQNQELKGIKEIIIEDYYRVKNFIKRRPTRLEMITYMDDDIYENMKKKSQLNIFKNYIKFLYEIDEIIEEEKELLGTTAEDFINMIERTSMSKTYKMPVLLAFYNKGNMKSKIDSNDIYRSFKEFYSNGSNGIDLTRHKSTKDYKNWGKEEYVKLAKNNPIKFLLKTEKEFFHKEKSYICINNNLNNYIYNKEFLKHFKDAIDFRVREYYKNRFKDNV